jgi:outer membrane protein OmpA-like peptidoglycan-associated protein
MNKAAVIRKRPWAGLALFACALFLPGCDTPQTNYQQLETRYQQSEAANRQLEAENAALRAQLGPQGQQNMYTVAADALFSSGDFDITPSGRTVLDDIAVRLRMLQNSKIVVYGYTDDEKLGAALLKQGIKSNLDLSSRRADAVADYLRAHGIDPKILSAKGRGETHPVAPNTSPAGRAQNRRIEIVIEGLSH